MTETVLTPLAQVLGEDFTDIRPMEEDGGLSRLFCAYKRSLQVEVVIKRMRADPAHPMDVRREARVMTGLRHQYLPRIFDLKMDGQGYCYTIMERIPGCTLRKYVQAHGALDQKQTLLWMKQLCQAAAYMHGQKPPVIHSDIKPENIMITPEGNICLIDFNVSLELREEGAEALGATQGYAAPEQYNVDPRSFGDPAALSPRRREMYDTVVAAQGYGRVTSRTDLYAIGAAAYFMLTGYDPPAWNQPPVPLSRYAITLGTPLQQVIERCMEPRPERRFSSAGEVLRALDGLARMDGRYKAWRRTCRTAALTVGCCLILSVFSAVWGWLLMRQGAGEQYNALIEEAQQLGDEMDYDGQQQRLLEAIALDRSRPEAYANLGALLYRQGDYQQAVSLLEDLDPNETGGLSQEEAAWAQGQIQYVLASCQYQMEEYDAALASYQLAAFFCPGEAAYQRDLAVCYARLGYDDKAQETVEALSLLTTQPGDTELVAGEIAYAAGRFEEALDLLGESARLSEDPGVISRASLQAALCCQQLGDAWLEEEIQLLQSAGRRLTAAENGAQIQMLAEAYMRRAALYPEERESSYEAALGYLSDLMGRGQPTFAVQQEAALVLEYLGRFEEAEEILLQLQTDYPADYRPPMRLALLYADWESRKDPEERDYQQMLAQYEAAEALYTDDGVPDSDMLRLRELADMLPNG